MDKKRGLTPPAVGASSLLVIFAVLCLTVFALLSISTVQADQRLSDSAAAAVQGYYAADCQAEEILARLRSGQIPDGVTESDGIYTYTCPISDTQDLAVEIAVQGTDYTILRWQAVSVAEWEADDRLYVWDGEEP
jgi:hypothetical protein